MLINSFLFYLLSLILIWFLAARALLVINAFQFDIIATCCCLDIIISNFAIVMQVFAILFVDVVLEVTFSSLQHYFIFREQFISFSQLSPADIYIEI